MPQTKPIVSVENVVANNFSKVKYISPKLHETLCKRIEPQKGDILLTRIGAISKTKLIDWDVDASIYVSLALIRLSGDVCKEYVYQYTKSDFFRQEIEKRALLNATPMKINLGEIGKVPVPIPKSKKEQEKIANILSTLDKKIELIDQEIIQTQYLKKGLMQKLFSEGLGFQDEGGNWRPQTKFRDSVFGSIPAIWETPKLDECVTKVGSGVTPKGGSAAYLETGVPLIRSQNILFGKFKLGNVAFISDSQHKKMKGSQLQARDVLLNITGASIGRCAVLPKDFDEGNVNQHVCIIRTTKDIIPEFMGIFLNSYLGQKQIWSLQAGGNREGLNFQQIRSFIVPVLPKNEQQAIIDICFTVEAKLDLLEQQKIETQQLKKGLMQKLFTGEWRVPKDDIEAA